LDSFNFLESILALRLSVLRLLTFVLSSSTNSKAVSFSALAIASLILKDLDSNSVNSGSPSVSGCYH
jgi:hypothetical protein